MPPRHTYWTILFGNQPTAFRAAEQEELLPTFKQIQAKHPDAVMMWFARGRLWKSPEEARDTFDRPRYDRPRGPRPDWKDRPHGDSPKSPASARWPNKAGYGGASPPASPKSRRDEGGKPRSGGGGAWQNRDDRPQGDRPRGPRPEWKDRPQGDRPKPPASARWPNKTGYGEGGTWRDKPHGKPNPPASARWPNKAGYGGASPPASPKSRRDEGGKPRSGGGGAWQNRNDRPQGDRPRGPRPEWKDRPQGDRPTPPASARWPNKTGYGEASPPASPKSRRNEGGKPRSGEGGTWREKPRSDRPPRPQGDVPAGERPPFKDPDKRGRDWRPGGAHKDPRDRFKVPRDVKRARFKHNLQRERANPRPPRKKKDEE
jgi:hypothetical protein